MDTIKRYVAQVAEFFDGQLGSALVEVYQLGSLAHGGFSTVYSDIDVGLLLHSTEAPAGMAEAILAAKDLDSEYGNKLSVFWGNPEYNWGRFPVIDRLDLLDHGVPLMHGRKPEFLRPTAAEVHQALLESFERSYRPRLAELSSLTRLEEHQRKPYIRNVLYPARLIYTWDRLAVDSNDRAVEYLHQIRPPGLDLEPIDRALACRQEKCTAEDVLALAPDLNRQFEAALKYLE
jgi:predicted nucleotidyltransferase